MKLLYCVKCFHKFDCFHLKKRVDFSNVELGCKEVQIIYRLFLVNCYLLHVPKLPFQPASNVGG